MFHHSFPTRRSSDLIANQKTIDWLAQFQGLVSATASPGTGTGTAAPQPAPSATNTSTKSGPVTAEDRKSTRLNSSHVKISYAVFCLKKKTKRIKCIK